MRCDLTLPDFPEPDKLLEELAALAPAAVRARMESGYGSPIRRTGALERDVRAGVAGDTVTVGCSLPYAPVIHAKRPFLTDGLADAAKTWKEGFR